MPGEVLTISSPVYCSHGAEASASSPSGRVKVNGHGVVTLATQYTVSGCWFSYPYGNGPCVSGQFVSGATRVTSDAQAVALIDSQSSCTPTGTPLVPQSGGGPVTAI